MANLQKYTLKQIIGEGASSTVYLGSSSVEKVAIKVVHKSDKTVEFARTELKALKALNSENVVKLIDLLETEKQVFIITELCDCNLVSFINDYDITEQVALKIVRMVLCGLSHIHEQNFVHRDIKLGNILLKGNVAKICDFGLSCQTNLNNFTFCGTLDYLAPEMMERNRYNEKIDIWAVGVVLYVLLTKRKFSGELDDIKCTNSTMGLLEKLLFRDPTVRPSADEALRDNAFSVFYPKLYDLRYLQDFMLATKGGNVVKEGLVLSLEDIKVVQRFSNLKNENEEVQSSFGNEGFHSLLVKSPSKSNHPEAFYKPTRGSEITIKNSAYRVRGAMCKGAMNEDGSTSKNYTFEQASSISKEFTPKEPLDIIESSDQYPSGIVNASDRYSSGAVDLYDNIQSKALTSTLCLCNVDYQVEIYTFNKKVDMHRLTNSQLKKVSIISAYTKVQMERTPLIIVEGIASKFYYTLAQKFIYTTADVVIKEKGNYYEIKKGTEKTKASNTNAKLVNLKEECMWISKYMCWSREAKKPIVVNEDIFSAIIYKLKDSGLKPVSSWKCNEKPVDKNKRRSNIDKHLDIFHGTLEELMKYFGMDQPNLNLSYNTLSMTQSVHYADYSLQPKQYFIYKKNIGWCIKVGVNFIFLFFDGERLEVLGKENVVILGNRKCEIDDRLCGDIKDKMRKTLIFLEEFI